MSTATIEVDDVPVSTAAPFPVALQSFLLTDPTNANSRLRVDVGQTSFFAGKEFRTFKELNMSSSQTYVIKAVVPINVVLWKFEVALTTGEVKTYTKVGGTEGGTFSETLPIFPRNNMSERPTPFYTPQVVLTAGGTHTGGTSLDLVWVKSADNTNFSSNVGQNQGEERGIAANTYYFDITAISASTGIITAWWEERP